MLLSGTEGAPQLTSDELSALVAVADAVQVGPRRRHSEDDAEVDAVTPIEAADNLAALLDAVATRKVSHVICEKLSSVAPSAGGVVVMSKSHV